MSDDMILVPAARLKELEEAEKTLCTMKEKQREKTRSDKTKMDRLKLLNERHKADPEAHRKHALEKYHENKDAINARRREARRLKREAAKAAAGAGEEGPAASP